MAHGSATTRKGFWVAVANDYVDLHLEEGEIVGLIGPNGAGKTTLFNCIAGFYPPTSGRVIFKGEDITGLPANEICLRGIARTFLIVRVVMELPVLDNVAGGLNRTNSTAKAQGKP
jgi:branched-chain amino acid transport system ATP-binding protein